MTDHDLWGNPVDPFQNAKERYGTWPMSVWTVNHQDQTTRRLRELIADQGEARSECFTKTAEDRSVYRGKVTESIFNPAVAAWLLNMYAPDKGLCVDPFAGGGTRAIMAAKHGLRYAGTEIREEEVRAVEARCVRAGVEDMIELHTGDARFLATYLGRGVGDFLLTCPPCWNLEQYDGGPADLSGLDYRAFLEALRVVVAETYAVLKPGARSCWVIGLVRGNEGELLPLHHELARIHMATGFCFCEEIVLVQAGNGAIQRVGQFEKGRKHLVRIHEYALVFER